MPQREPLPLIGASAKNLPGQSGRVINLYPEQLGSDAKSPFVLKHVPGSFRWGDVSAASFIDTIPDSIRGMHVMGSRAFCASGNYLLEINPDNTFSVIGRLATYNGVVGFSDNGGTLVVGDGRFYTIVPGIGELTPVITVNGDQLRGYWSEFINSQTLYFIRGSDRCYYSDVGAPQTVDDLSYFTEEGSADQTVAAFVSNREIVILGQDSTGWRHNGGQADDPFERIGHTDHGCVGARAACKFDNTVAVVGRNKAGQGGVWRLGTAGSEPVPISTPVVSGHVKRVLFSAADLADQITLYSYDEGEHRFLFVNLPEVPATINAPLQPSMTWVYDATEGAWHERARRNPETGRFERVLGDYHIAWRGRHYLGDHLNPHIYEFSADYYRENTIPIVKLVETQGPLNIEGRRFTVHGIELQLEVGVGRDGDAAGGTDPKVVFQASWDGGNTWSDEVVRDIGRIGAFNTSVRFGPAGSGRNFVARFFISDPVRVTLTGAFADVTVGAR